MAATELFRPPSSNPKLVECAPMLVLAIAGVQRKWDTVTEPSWVPAFDELTEECARKQRSYVQLSSSHHAGGYTDIKFSTNNDTHLLLTRSKIIGTVRTVCKGSQYRAEFHEKDTATKDDAYWNRRIAGCFPWYVKCIEAISSLANPDQSRAMSLPGIMFHDDPWFENLDNEISAADEGAIKIFRRWLETAQTSINSIFDKATIEKGLKMLIRFSWDFQDLFDRTRVLASTSTGLVGWIPEGAKPGDAVMLLQGAPLPFIFRRRPDGYYSVIGDAYIQGVMQGEQWPEDDETGIEWIDIM